jgi:RNA polymerase-binding transcription factor DksA
MAARPLLNRRTVDRLTKDLKARRACAAEVADAFRSEGRDALATADLSDRFDAVSPIDAVTEESFLLADKAEEIVREIDRALSRIATGTYGRCEDCGGPIPIERLEALPATPLCVACKRRSVVQMIGGA